jgi:chemotaxis response regulator CheB
MTDHLFSAPEVPDHIDEAVRSVARLHSEHHGRTRAPQRAVNRITAFMAKPVFIVLVGVGVSSGGSAQI